MTTILSAAIYTAETMTVPEALKIAAVGIMTVFLLLLFIDALVVLISRAVRAAEKLLHKDKTAKPGQSDPTTPTNKRSSAATERSVTLTDVSEADAAVIMAIVSHRSGIPPERLKFNSIKLVGDEEK